MIEIKTLNTNIKQILNSQDKKESHRGYQQHHIVFQKFTIKK